VITTNRYRWGPWIWSRPEFTEVLIVWPACQLCSTPFGITEVGMREAIWASVSLAVCSTPFGITEVGI